MDYKKKVFVNKDLSDVEIAFVKSMLDEIDLKQYLKTCFVYIDLCESGSLEIISIVDEHVLDISKQYDLPHKMAMEYIRNKTEIDQNLNMLLYWNGLNNMKKYVAYNKNEDNEKHYAHVSIYPDNKGEAYITLAGKD